MAFHLGSLGFLTPFNFDNFEEHVTEVLEGMVTKILFLVCSYMFINYCIKTN